MASPCTILRNCCSSNCFSAAHAGLRNANVFLTKPSFSTKGLATRPFQRVPFQLLTFTDTALRQDAMERFIGCWQCAFGALSQGWLAFHEAANVARNTDSSQGRSVSSLLFDNVGHITASKDMLVLEVVQLQSRFDADATPAIQARIKHQTGIAGPKNLTVRSCSGCHKDLVISAVDAPASAHIDAVLAGNVDIHDAFAADEFNAELREIRHCLVLLLRVASAYHLGMRLDKRHMLLWIRTWKRTFGNLRSKFAADQATAHHQDASRLQKFGVHLVQPG